MMDVMPDRLALVRAYCRIGEDELPDTEELLFRSMVRGAMDYLAGAGVRPPLPGASGEDSYWGTICPMVLDAWDKRGTSSPDRTLTDNPAWRRGLNQLKARSWARGVM